MVPQDGKSYNIRLTPQVRYDNLAGSYTSGPKQVPYVATGRYAYFEGHIWYEVFHAFRGVGGWVRKDVVAIANPSTKLTRESMLKGYGPLGSKEAIVANSLLCQLTGLHKVIYEKAGKVYNQLVAAKAAGKDVAAIQARYDKAASDFTTIQRELAAQKDKVKVVNSISEFSTTAQNAMKGAAAAANSGAGGYGAEGDVKVLRGIHGIGAVAVPVGFIVLVSAAVAIAGYAMLKAWLTPARDKSLVINDSLDKIATDLKAAGFTQKQIDVIKPIVEKEINEVYDAGKEKGEEGTLFKNIQSVAILGAGAVAAVLLLRKKKGGRR